MKFWAAVEAKVKAAALGTLGASLAVAVLNDTVGDSDLLGSLPAWLQFILVTGAPPLLAFLAGYKARHTAVPPTATAAPVKPVA